mmetsp:Transcript_34602/g.81576  ORF Transcript_34602/g.81576 Transcript_34602/m.81576 type:complete len:88 (-) Transcript_34602:492-755(-)
MSDILGNAFLSSHRLRSLLLLVSTATGRTLRKLCLIILIISIVNGHKNSRYIESENAFREDTAYGSSGGRCKSVYDNNATLNTIATR